MPKAGTLTRKRSDVYYFQFQRFLEYLGLCPKFCSLATGLFTPTAPAVSNIHIIQSMFDIRLRLTGDCRTGPEICLKNRYWSHGTSSLSILISFALSLTITNPKILCLVSVFLHSNLLSYFPEQISSEKPHFHWMHTDRPGEKLPRTRLQSSFKGEFGQITYFH